jgi:hypothetical protein
VVGVNTVGTTVIANKTEEIAGEAVNVTMTTAVTVAGGRRLIDAVGVEARLALMTGEATEVVMRKVLAAVRIAMERPSTRKGQEEEEEL